MVYIILDALYIGTSMRQKGALGLVSMSISEIKRTVLTRPHAVIT